MNTGALIIQILILFGMIFAGYFSFRLRYFGKTGFHEINTLIAKVLAPCMMVASLTGNYPENASSLMLQNVILAAAYFAVLIAGGCLYVLIRRPDRRNRNIDLLTLIFSNVGFFAIPLVKGLFGDDYVIYLIVYIMVFNILIYSLGAFFAMGTAQGGERKGFSLKRMINSGTVTASVVLILFILKVSLPAPLLTFTKYMGDMCVPLSMMMIGASLAQLSLREVFSGAENWIFTVVKMLIVPGAGILIMRLFPFDRQMFMIFFIELAMPSASLAGVLAEEYGHAGNEVNKLVALTTLFSAVSIPLLSLLV